MGRFRGTIVEDDITIIEAALVFIGEVRTILA